MSEALRKHAPEVEIAYAEPLADLLPPLVPAEQNDNEVPTALRSGERVGFEVPPGIWTAMVACYGVFIAAVLAATAGGYATFSIVIAVIYLVMFFGVTKLMVKEGPEQPRSPLARHGGVLRTIYGPLARGEVAAQMLVVPMAIAFFGVAILVIRLAVA
jgi:hypothetical protein